MSAGADLVSSCDPHVGCVTCGDEATPLLVKRVDARDGLAECESGEGIISLVEIALVDPVNVGDVLLVHAGTAIAHAAPQAVRP